VIHGSVSLPITWVTHGGHFKYCKPPVSRTIQHRSPTNLIWAIESDAMSHCFKLLKIFTSRKFGYLYWYPSANVYWHSSGNDLRKRAQQRRGYHNRNSYTRLQITLSDLQSHFGRSCGCRGESENCETITEHQCTSAGKTFGLSRRHP